jgi:hypothetical protein
MRTWLVLASHDERGQRDDQLTSDPDALERVTHITTPTDERPTEAEIQGAFEGYGDGGEFLFVPLDGDAFTGRVEIATRVEIVWRGNYA